MMNILKQIFASPSADIKDKVKAGAYLVDVRTPGEFKESHVLGSVNIPLDRVPAEISKFKNKTDIIVFCRSGNRSVQAKSILDQHGINNVVNGGTWDYVNQFVRNK